jgi:TonB family protein
MTLLLDLAIRSSVLLAAGLTFDALLRSRAAALRHAVLGLSVLAAVVVAPLSLTVPAWEVTVPQRATSAPGRLSVAATEVAEVPSEPSPIPRPAVTTSAQPDPISFPLLPMLWLAGWLVAGSSLLVGVRRLSRVAGSGTLVEEDRWLEAAADLAHVYGIRRRVRLILTPAPDLLATWGCLGPAVLLPSHASTWSDERIRIVLAHEFAHIRRHDWLVQIGAEALRTMLWFNPLIWIACTRLRRASEQACDDAVLGSGVSAGQYAAHLIELARKCRRPAAATAMSMAHPSTLERRIVAMLNPRLDRQAVSRRALTAAAALVLAVTLPAASVRGVQEGPRVLSGVFYDTTGAVLPGVPVTLEDGNQQKQTDTTDRSGRFEFGVRSAGKYVLSASLPGFRPLKQEFELRTAQDWDRAVTLQVGTVTESISVRSSRISAPATDRPQGPRPVRVGGNIRIPRKLQDVRPVYPESMRAAGRQGIVRLDATISSDGSVLGTRVLSADVHPDFAIAAVDAVRQWQFSPTLLNGKPVEVVMTVTVTFNLEN